MRVVSCLLLAFWTICVPSLDAQPRRELHGRLVWVEDHGERSPAAGVEIVPQAGDALHTDSDGSFRLPLPPVFRPGETVTVTVAADGWFVGRPAGGELRIPHTAGSAVEVELYREGSELFWSHERVETFLLEAAELALERLGSSELQSGIGLDFYIRRWAHRNGWSPEKARLKVDAWVERAAAGNDRLRRGLAALARAEMIRAAELFHAAGQEAQRQLAEARGNASASEAEIDRLVRRINRSFVLEGTVHFVAARFDQAAAALQRAMAQVSRQDSPQLWARTLHAASTVLVERGADKRNDREFRESQLRVALQGFEAVLQVFTAEHFPLRWASARHGLGRAQSQLAGFRGGLELTKEALATFESALAVRTRHRHPHLWASTQLYSILPMLDLARAMPGKPGRALLAAAIPIFSQVGEIRTLEETPDLWAINQSNLAAALGYLAERTPGPEGSRLLEEMAAVCRHVLEILEDEIPQVDAYSRQVTYGHLARALTLRAERPGDRHAWYVQAAEARRRALALADREVDPADWGVQAYELGTALLKLAKASDDGERAAVLEEAGPILSDAAAEAEMAQLSPTLAYSNLAEVRWLQGRAAEAVLILREALRADPHYREGHLMLRFWAQEVLYDFELAYQTLRRWLEVHPDELGGRIALTQNLFTTGRFESCLENVEALRGHPQVGAEDQAFLLAFEIAVRRVLGHPPKTIADLLHELARHVPRLRAGLTTAWQTGGTTQFLRRNTSVPHRRWVLNLFDVLRTRSDTTALVEELEKLAENVDLPEA